MIHLRGLIDVYIDINILLFAALFLWVVARFLLRILGLKHAYSTQLRLLNGVFLATLLTPIAATFLLSQFSFGSASSVNVSDFLLSQYLNGNFEMSATKFESLLSLRHSFVNQISDAGSVMNIVVVGFVLTGAAIGFLRLFLGIWQLRALLYDSYAWRKIGNINLRISDTVTVPFSTRGFWRKVVVIPSEMLENATDLKLVLAHEFQHLRQSDLAWEIVLEFLKPLFFWNPAFLIWKRRVEVLRELACDQHVIARKNIDVVAYCECLFKVCKNSIQPRRLFLIHIPHTALVETRQSLFGPKSGKELHARVLSLLESNTLRRQDGVFLYFIVPLLIAVILVTAAIQKPNDWSQDRLMLSSIVNLENLAKLNGQTPEIQISENR